MAEITLTPEQEARAKQAFAERSFDPEEYCRNLCPEIPPEIQVELAEQELRAADPALIGTPVESRDLETLAEKRSRANDVAEEFCFLDPLDYVNQEETSKGRLLTPLEFWHKLKYECHLDCYFSLADESMIAKELNPRDVALAYRKIGENPENLHNMDRWRAAIAEIRQEESRRQPLCNYERFALQVCRKPDHPEYVTWLPGCTLREYALVKFDSHGVPDFYIPGWRDGLIALIRKRMLTERLAHKVFGEAVGPRSRRYKMILANLRNRPYHDEDDATSVDVSAAATEPAPALARPADDLPTAEDLDAVAEEEAIKAKFERCSECNWAYGEHRPDCSRINSGGA